MSIIIKPNASPNGDIKVEAGGIIFYFPEGTTEDEINSEVKRAVKREIGLVG